MSESNNKAYAWLQIRSINGKINSTRIVISSLTGYKSEIDAGILSWKSERDRLTGHYLSVKTYGSFQGDMAEKLKGDMSQIYQTINAGITSAEGLSSAVQSQITSLEGYISSLETQKKSYTAIINS